MLGTKRLVQIIIFTFLKMSTFFTTTPSLSPVLYITPFISLRVLTEGHHKSLVFSFGNTPVTLEALTQAPTPDTVESLEYHKKVSNK